MKLVADESIDRGIVERLRADGHDVLAIAECDPSISDDEVLDRANAEGSLLLTGDKDFGELVYRLNRIHAGVVLVRLAGLSEDAKAKIVAEVFRGREQELVGGFAVISPGMVRIRQTLPPDP
ncbi:MAG: DUF5615 family PIN-like protein [Planctomycetota bacterium]